MKKEEIDYNNLNNVLYKIEKLNLVSNDWWSDKTWTFKNNEWKIEITLYKDCVQVDIMWNNIDIKTIECNGERCTKYFEEFKKNYKERLQERIYSKFLQI